jgi:hypothetical protein
VSSSTARARLCRQRARAGKVPIHIEVDEISTELLLIHHGLLPAYGTDDRRVFEDALTELSAV